MLSRSVIFISMSQNIITTIFGNKSVTWIFCEFTGEPPSYDDVFEINAATGEITLKKSIEGTEPPSYQIAIEAKESTSGKTSVAYLVVSLRFCYPLLLC